MYRETLIFVCNQKEMTQHAQLLCEKLLLSPFTVHPLPKVEKKMQTNAHRRGLFSSVSSSSTSSSQPYPRCLRKVVAYASFPPSVPMLTLMSWALMEPLSSRGECQTSPFTHGCLKDSSLTGQKEG